MPTATQLGIPLASLSADASIEEAVNPGFERVAAIMAWRDQGAFADRPSATTARKGQSFLWRWVITRSGSHWPARREWPQKSAGGAKKTPSARRRCGGSGREV